MRNHLFGIAAFAALAVSGSAQAADGADNAAWNGFYVGAGAGFRNSQTDVTTTAIDVGGTVFPFHRPPLSFNGTAFWVSPYVGFNWQIAPQWIVGPEGDYGFAHDSSTVLGQGFTPRGPLGPINTRNIADSLVVKAGWDASLRARAGFLFTPSILGYLTGGVAWQHYNLTSTCSTASSVFLGTGDCSKNDLFNPTGFDVGPPVIKNSVTQTGWTIGGGLETVLWDNWLLRAEYRYADFGSSPFSTVRTALGGVGSTEGTHAKVAMQTHTVTFGIAYEFN